MAAQALRFLKRVIQLSIVLRMVGIRTQGMIKLNQGVQNLHHRLAATPGFDFPDIRIVEDQRTDTITRIQYTPGCQGRQFCCDH